MPNRIIRDGWIESERIDKLDVHSERFFLRLILRADDFGRYHANPQLLKSNLFPLREDIRNTDMTRCLAECERAGLVRSFEANGGRYVVIQDFKQRTRATESKFPAPPTDVSQVPVIGQADDRQPRTYAYSETETETETSAETDAHARAVRGTMPEALAALGIPFREAWERWLVDLAQRKYGRPPTNHQCHLHQVALLKIATEGGSPIVAIDNAIAKGLPVPCLPFDGPPARRAGPPQPETVPENVRNYIASQKAAQAAK